MESMETKLSGSNKPIVGMVIVLFVALFIGGWLYVDSTRGELEMKVKNLADQLAAMKAKNAQSALEAWDAETKEPEMESEAQGWETVSGSLGGYPFQVDIPDAWHLSTALDGQSAHIVLKPTPENETPVPDMEVELIARDTERYALISKERQEASKLVPTADGHHVFWIHMWEDFLWPESSRVLASFKLK